MTSLSELTTIKVGGTPKQLLVAKTKQEVIDYAFQIWDATENWLVLGAGSNIVANDFLGSLQVIKIATAGIEEIDGVVRVQAGVDWNELVSTANDHGWQGIESLAGIPGTVGAAPIQNIGAYGQEVSSVIKSVEFLDYETREVIIIDQEFCNFGYRDSVFKQGRKGIVLSVDFIFGSELSSVLNQRSEEVLAQRKAKGMVLDDKDPDTFSCGSFFVNPFVSESFARTLPIDAPQFPEGDRIKLSAAWLIEKSGVAKGFSLPGSKAAVSSKHSLAITNRGGATANEIVELASFIQTQVGNHFGIYLVPEPNLIGF
jgi:UDP-N-acetylmuramate dehydrogenase